MKLQIDRRHIEPMMQAFPRLDFVREQLRYGNRVEVPFGQLEAPELGMLQALYAGSRWRQRKRSSAAARCSGDSVRPKWRRTDYPPAS